MNASQRCECTVLLQAIGIPVAAVYLFNIDFTVVILLNAWMGELSLSLSLTLARSPSLSLARSPSLGVSGGLLSPVSQGTIVQTHGRPVALILAH